MVETALHRHKKSEHEGVIYKCETCDAQFPQKGNLSNHIKSRHQNEDVKYPCGLCGYQAKRKSNLSAHNRTIHHADVLECNVCPFKTGYKRSLIRHKNRHIKSHL